MKKYLDKTGLELVWSKVKAQIQAVLSVINSHVNNLNNPHKVSKSQVGLGNADNTSDLNKPISTATQAALDEKLDRWKEFSEFDVEISLSRSPDANTTRYIKLFRLTGQKVVEFQFAYLGGYGSMTVDRGYAANQYSADVLTEYTKLYYDNYYSNYVDVYFQAGAYNNPYASSTIFIKLLRMMDHSGAIITNPEAYITWGGTHVDISNDSRSYMREGDTLRYIPPKVSTSATVIEVDSMVEYINFRDNTEFIVTKADGYTITDSMYFAASNYSSLDPGTVIDITFQTDLPKFTLKDAGRVLYEYSSPIYRGDVLSLVSPVDSESDWFATLKPAAFISESLLISSDSVGRTTIEMTAPLPASSGTFPLLDSNYKYARVSHMLSDNGSGTVVTGLMFDSDVSTDAGTNMNVKTYLQPTWQNVAEHTSPYLYLYLPAESGTLALRSDIVNYTLPAAGSGLGGVKSGGDVTISEGLITVNNDSHTHNYTTISPNAVTSAITDNTEFLSSGAAAFNLSAPTIYRRSASSLLTYINNSISGTYATKSEVTTNLNSKEDSLSTMTNTEIDTLINSVCT